MLGLVKEYKPNEVGQCFLVMHQGKVILKNYSNDKKNDCTSQ